MKLISWNVNGIRACLTKGFMDYFNTSSADVFCIQETKMQEGQAEFDMPDYFKYFHSAVKKGYSGTAVFCKKEPLSVNYGMHGMHTDEGRVLTLEFEHYYLINCYSPNSQHELLRLDYRMEFEDAMRAYMCELSRTKPVILCGDLNVAHNEIDLKNPKNNTDNPGFTPGEREKMSLLLDSGFTDTFRHLHPDDTNAYTWWSYRFGAREKNIGWRIDYFIVSNSIADKITKSGIQSDVLGSDHCPVCLEIDI